MYVLVWYKATKPVINSAAKLSVCSGLDNTCYDISDSVIISVNNLNERLNKINTFEIKAIILETSPLDLIICRATIKFGTPSTKSIPQYRKSAYNRVLINL